MDLFRWSGDTVDTSARDCCAKTLENSAYVCSKFLGVPVDLSRLANDVDSRIFGAVKYQGKTLACKFSFEKGWVWTYSYFSWGYNRKCSWMVKNQKASGFPNGETANDVELSHRPTCSSTIRFMNQKTLTSIKMRAIFIQTVGIWFCRAIF